MRSLSPSLWLARLCFGGLLLFELLNLIGVLKFSLSFTWLGLIITLSAVWIALELVRNSGTKQQEKPLGSWIFWVVFVMICVDAGGDIFHWYNTYSWYDQIVHFVGGFSAGILTGYLLWRSEKIYHFELPAFLYITAATGITIAFGALYEMEEYLEDVFTHSQRLGDGFDTANDLLLDSIGGLCAVLIIWWFWQRRKRSS